MLLYYAGLIYEKAVCFPARATKQSVNGGTWYPWPPGQAGFQRYTVVSFGPRSAMSDYSAILNGE